MGNKVQIVCVVIVLLLGAGVSGQAVQEDIEGVIRLLDDQVASAESDEERAKFCCFRARNYRKLKETDQAEQDYLEALDYDYAGWILNEYGYFLYRNGEYERAYRAAYRLNEDFPHFQDSALKLKNMARVKYQEAYNAANPPTIIMNSEVDPYRVTRHDLIRSQGQGQAKLFKTDLKKSSPSKRYTAKASAKKTKKSSTKKKRS